MTQHVLDAFGSDSCPILPPPTILSGTCAWKQVAISLESLLKQCPGGWPRSLRHLPLGRHPLKIELGSFARVKQAGAVVSNIVHVWLRRKLRAAIAWNAVAVAGCFLGGLLVLYVSFWVSYGVIWFIFHSFFPHPHRTIVLIDAVFMTIVVIVGARQNWEDLEPLQREVHLARDMDITLTPYSRYGISYDTNAVKAGVFEVRSVASLINFFLCGGVKLVFSSRAKLRQLRRLKAIDVEACARVILRLQMLPKRQSFHEIVENLPGLNPVKTFDDLRYVDGVLFLSNDPPGLTLLPQLRDELNLFFNR